MDEEAVSPQPSTVDDVDRRLLLLLATGRSAVEAGELVGLTATATAVRLRALRRRLGVTSTTEAVAAVCGTGPWSPSQHVATDPPTRRPEA